MRRSVFFVVSEFQSFFVVGSLFAMILSSYGQRSLYFSGTFSNFSLLDRVRWLVFFIETIFCQKISVLFSFYSNPFQLRCELNRPSYMDMGWKHCPHISTVRCKKTIHIPISSNSIEKADYTKPPNPAGEKMEDISVNSCEEGGSEQ